MATSDRFWTPHRVETWLNNAFVFSFAVMMGSALAASEPSPHQDFYFTMVGVGLLGILILIPTSIIVEERGLL